MAFHDVRLPESVSRNYQGGPKFQTAIVQLVSGLESRNSNWSLARGEWDIGYPLDESQFDIVRAFFYARAGAAHAFRFKDWSDFNIGNRKTGAYQSIGTGDGTTQNYQVYKRYESGGFSYDRTTTKLVSSTTRIWVDDIEQLAGWTVAPLTGVVTFVTAPANGLDVSVATEFDATVRFATDQFRVAMSTHTLGAVPSIPLIEVKGE